ncbi:MAG: hypothetical protein LUH54_02735 [Firmicutes bacterium]|nr:hypothetical protein [Bacillota bacterium]
MKKILSALLALLVICVPVIFSACSDSADNEGTDTTTAADDTAAGTGGDETEEVVETLDIPNVTYPDYTYTILCHTDVAYNYGSVDFDEPSDDAREQALYQRGVAVEELLECTIDMKQAAIGDGVYQLFKTDVDAGLDTYAMIINNNSYTCSAVGSGYCLNVDELEYIDLSKSWWNDDCTEQLAIGGNHYMIAGDIALSDKECIWAVYFLKDVLEEVASDVNIYDLVLSGEWTWDQMYSISKLAVRDVNGNGTRDQNDRYGITTHWENWAASWQAAGLKLVTLDSNGIPQVSWGTDEFFEVFEDIKTIMNDTDTVSPNDDSFIYTSVLQGQTLFATEVVAHAMNYRDSEYDFGIVPYPKYSADQERYYSYVAVWACVCSFPLTTSNFERTSVITEALAYYGQEYLMPAYYETQLQSRFIRDEESADMLDIIFEHRSYDLGVYFDWGSAYSKLSDADANPATLYASLSKSINKAIEKSLDKLGIYS